MDVLRYAVLFLFCITHLSDVVQSDGLIEVFQWKQMDFYNRGDGKITNDNTMNQNFGNIVFPDQLPQRGSYSGRRIRNTQVMTSRDDPKDITSRFSAPVNNNASASYIPYNNVPMGVTHFNGRLFITMPRRRVGIPSTLNYIDLSREGRNPSPKLHAYPNFEMNQLNENLMGNPNHLVSVYRTSVDACDRLWFIDTGMLEYPNSRMQIQRPALWVMDLKNNDALVRKFEIPEATVATGRGLASVTVDVKSNNCNQAFAYIPDLVENRLYVYSFEQNHIWAFSHNYFNFDPLAGDLSVGGQTFRWDDGIFSITLGPLQPNGYRSAMFHPMASNNEFVVSTEVLQNEANAARSDHGRDFQLLGNRGNNRQSTMHDYDPRTGTVFYAEIQRNAVSCWNTKKQFTSENHGTVASDAQRMIYPSDLTVDNEGTLWLMTNSMPIFIYSNLDPNVVNFRVWNQKTNKAIQNTVCA